MKTFKDVYKLPLQWTDREWSNRVIDQDNNFVFQFVSLKNNNQKFLDVINGQETFKNPTLRFHHKDGDIKDHQGESHILIRGWGNLTGTSAMNLSPENATNIQDTFAEYIVQQLNKRE